MAGTRRVTRRDVGIALMALAIGAAGGVYGERERVDARSAPRRKPWRVVRSCYAERPGFAVPAPTVASSSAQPSASAIPPKSDRPPYESFKTITGPRTSCTQQESGVFVIDKPGSYSGICVTNGNIEIRANDVVLTDFSVINTGDYKGTGNLVRVLDGFSNQEIAYGRMSNDNGFGWGLYPWKDTYAHHLDISGTGDGMQVGMNGRFEYVWIHDLTTRDGGHVDAVQLVGGREGNTEIAYSRLDGPFKGQTSAIIIKADLGPIDGVNVHDNYLSGGAYTVYVYDMGSRKTTNVRLDRNQFLRDSYVYAALATLPVKSPPEQIVSKTDNVYDDGTRIW